MSEEILRIQLAELLETIRVKKSNGTIIEGSGVESARNIFAELRDSRGNEKAGQSLLDLINLMHDITSPAFPFQVEFTIKVKK